jgi:hypothetical protein
MDGADTGATGGPITHGGPGDIGGLDLKAVDSVDSLFFRIPRAQWSFSGFRNQNTGLIVPIMPETPN